MSIRIITCEVCDGDKGWDVPYEIDRTHGGTIDHWVPCRACDETGEVEIEVEPIEMGDLDEPAEARREGRPLAHQHQHRGGVAGMCDCIKTTDGFLAEHGTSLVTNLLSKPLRVVVATYYSGPKKRSARASTMLASYCPFCGEKYPPYADIFAKAESDHA